MNFEIKNAETHHLPDISRIHALSWKRAYAGIIPKDYLNELKHDAWVPFFNTYLNNGLKAKIICENLKMLGCKTALRMSKMKNCKKLDRPAKTRLNQGFWRV